LFLFSQVLDALRGDTAVMVARYSFAEFGIFGETSAIFFDVPLSLCLFA